MRPFYIFDLQTEVNPPFMDGDVLIGFAQLMELEASFFGAGQRYVKVSGNLDDIQALKGHTGVLPNEEGRDDLI
ncbi:MULTISPECIES: hypothetical protein [unclassified Rhizobium]|uniref:hypothetical protein n=1 Tax=unclassified Rhizobium TaxID=2613769 RepID=UPI001AD9D7C5|nr:MULTISPECIES: hypothetical protein [unclassified Rhizobium]MBO9123121.1 hypothetical protein [Rhizobium sp. 16-488-2b]MBO9173653.1 hypothetical protein [Rhizobium sp. 16-488-2a]